MTKGSLLVSVLTPSFNQCEWLPLCLASVEEQTYGCIEHIVVDGASTDGSVDLLAASSNPALRWISEQDRGQTHALAKAFSLARGEIIGWVNGDDAYYDPRVIEDIVVYFERHPNVDVVYGHAALVAADGEVLHMIWRPPGVLVPLLLRMNANFFIQPAVFMRRRTLISGFVDERYESSMDHELWIRLAKRASFGQIGRVIAIDRHHGQRKVITRPDLAARDRALMADVHGAMALRTAGFRVAILSALFRLVGVCLAADAIRIAPFAGHVGSRRNLVLRQLFRRRISMPLG